MEKVDFKTFSSEVAVKGFSHGVILQHGEVTGHHHLLNSINEVIDLSKDVEDYVGDEIFIDKLQLTEEGVITHHEHWPHKVEPGTWVKSIQQAYDPYERKNMPVMD